MKISPIAACDLQMTIGKDNDLPWRLPADLRYFKTTTMGKPVIMGRRTFESLSGPLVGRLNVILTRQQDYAADGVEIAHSVDEALEIAGDEAAEHEELMILGGARVYQQFLPISDRLYLTVVYDRFEGDTFFPAFDMDQWEVASVEHHQADATNPHPYSFWQLERVAAKPVTAKRQEAPGELPKELLER
ncbi:MAG: type 3 dihydrofolate reductase [Persicimonas sp.]